MQIQKANLRYAFIISGSYLLVSSLYIIFSSQYVASSARTLEELATIETIKGILFVLTTSLLIFFMSKRCLKRQAQMALSQRSQREALLISEKRALPGIFAQTVVHDCNNILQGLSLRLHRLGQLVEGEEAQSEFEKIEASAEKLQSVLNRLRELSGRVKNESEDSTSINDLVSQAIDLCQQHEGADGVRIQFQKNQSPVRVRHSSDLIYQSLINLLINAIEAAPQRGKVLVSVTETSELAKIEVHDNGPGLTEEDKNRVLEGFYSTKENGTGLGLLSVRFCLEKCGGQLYIHPSPLGGACFQMLIPKAGQLSPQAMQI